MGTLCSLAVDYTLSSLMVQHFTTSYCTKIMACRQVWISNKNVCVLYHVTAAAGLLREPQPSPSTLARARTHTHSWQEWDVCFCSGLTEAAGVGPEQREWAETPMTICVRPETRARHWPGVTRGSFLQQQSFARIFPLLNSCIFVSSSQREPGVMFSLQCMSGDDTNPLP